MWLPKMRFDYLVVNLTLFTNRSVYFTKRVEGTRDTFFYVA